MYNYDDAITVPFIIIFFFGPTKMYDNDFNVGGDGATLG